MIFEKYLPKVQLFKVGDRIAINNDSRGKIGVIVKIEVLPNGGLLYHVDWDGFTGVGSLTNCHLVKNANDILKDML